MTSIASPRRAQATKTALKLAAAAIGALTLTACEHFDSKPSHSAGWALIEPSERHPIMVSQKRHGMNLQIARHQHGLSSGQRTQLYNFIEQYRAVDGGNSKVVISVPAGSANEVAAMRAVADIRPMLAEQGFADASVSIEPYHADGGHAPIKVAYTRFHAEAPECGRWPDDITKTSRNLNYHNYGCTQQRNLANMIANPADLLGPRTMSPSNADRRDVVYEKYIKGEPSHGTRSGEERATRGTSF
jgi:pilus assembly protein CpaD